MKWFGRQDNKLDSLYYYRFDHIRWGIFGQLGHGDVEIVYTPKEVGCFANIVSGAQHCLK